MGASISLGRTGAQAGPRKGGSPPWPDLLSLDGTPLTPTPWGRPGGERGLAWPKGLLGGVGPANSLQLPSLGPPAPHWRLWAEPRGAGLPAGSVGSGSAPAALPSLSCTVFRLFPFLPPPSPPSPLPLLLSSPPGVRPTPRSSPSPPPPPVSPTHVSLPLGVCSLGTRADQVPDPGWTSSVLCLGSGTAHLCPPALLSGGP